MRKTLATALVLAALLVGSSAEATPTTGLVAYFPFSGNAQDASGSGNHGSVHGASLTADRFGRDDRAYYFDGDDFIQAPHSPILELATSMTLAAWVRHDTGTSPQHIVNMTEFTRGYRLAAWRGNPVGYAGEFYTESGSQNLVWDGVLPLIDVWTHVATTWDGTTFAIYRNGQLASTRPTFGQIGPSSNDLFIGVLSVSGVPVQGFFRGDIDDVRVYDRALSAEEVAQVVAVPEPSTVVLLLGTFAVLSWVRRAA